MTHYRRLGRGDTAVVLAAPHLFDAPPTQAWTDRFLTAAGHHLIFAFDGDTAVGFVSGVEMTHPDKGTEMFLYELGVDEPARGRGIGRALAQALVELARELGCYGAWTGTEHDNERALRTYRGTGASAEPGTTILVWEL
ncbi:GNAT family N-acetyltransferase [Rhodococcoides kyotonense]|uniref:Acetyltransferase (GNAT) family protein n=1 Tax=Rhodococcoides kyotonense TaxID=398843 RepID=A0A239KGF0_9NOCA|nr:GNAT family N-acetyltransferase [Rhodococcus kyotonensis]SNT16713.1 Acetyltransferase (GNAT) family protein [Rhodococcus kyotonensis]